MLLPEFSAGKKHDLRDDSRACLSEDLANMQKKKQRKKKEKSEATSQRITVSGGR